jgi:hypothetical protein
MKNQLINRIPKTMLELIKALKTVKLVKLLTFSGIYRHNFTCESVKLFYW